ncbi:HAD superfamily hydrolase (TIGR01509 family) [Pseudoduganella lurida]|uniref:HAD superfamily hydrolase (TIGR01509 family) n=1 Tax=Pseudoduganella lurida TaxID=1036180 RepID=A0A562RF44_9BURK|nr:HAD-IA family hydrolase [Pseudoduganella lurida]TWI67672.1 HAD superfamily hydrolase (TIGR01509 family) [Pseudoduganella lurida]
MPTTERIPHRITHLVSDCDGVLIDSEAVALQALADHLAPLGADRERLIALIRPRLGLKLEALTLGVCAELGLPEPTVADLAILRSVVEHACDTQATPVPGVHEALAAIPLTKAVASNSRLVRVQALLGRTGLAELFAGGIYTADIAGRPKPDPAVYLAAAAGMGVGAAHCVVVEDSVTGVHAAVAAGATVLGFTGGPHSPAGQADRLREAGAVATFDAMAELPALVDRIRSAG